MPFSPILPDPAQSLPQFCPVSYPDSRLVADVVRLDLHIARVRHRRRCRRLPSCQVPCAMYHLPRAALTPSSVPFDSEHPHPVTGYCLFQRRVLDKYPQGTFLAIVEYLFWDLSTGTPYQRFSSCIFAVAV